MRIKTKLPSKGSGGSNHRRKRGFSLLQRPPKGPPVLVRVFIPGSKEVEMRI